VTLRQFSLPWSDTWRGDRYDYILSMTEKSSDESLIDLALHVGYRFEAAPIGLEPSFWRQGMLRVFLSHLAAHRLFAARLQDCLHSFGISTFVAHNDIEPTKDWQTQIEAALSTCDSLVALLHPGFHESSWTDQEVGFAMGRGVPVFSVGFGQDPYGFLGRFQAFKGDTDLAPELALDLFTAYRKHKQTRRRMAEVVVTRFIESESFAAAKLRMGWLEELDFWEKSFSKRLESAAESNSQIANAWRVPERVNALIKKWAASEV
jgi:hypothetical protein